MNGQSWGLKIRVDTSALRALTAGAAKINEASAAIKEMNGQIDGVMSKLSAKVGGIGENAGKTIQALQAKIDALEQKAASAKGRPATAAAPTVAPAAGGVGGGALPITTRGPEATRKWMMNYLGLSQPFLKAHPMKGVGTDAATGGGIPAPRQVGGVRQYDTIQIMGVLLQGKVAYPIMGKLDELKAAFASGGTAAGQPGNLEKAAIDRLGLTIDKLAGTVVKLTETVVAMETLSKRAAATSAGHSGGPPPPAGHPLDPSFASTLLDQPLAFAVRHRRKSQYDASGELRKLGRKTLGDGNGVLNNATARAGQSAESFGRPDLGSSVAASIAAGMEAMWDNAARLVQANRAKFVNDPGNKRLAQTIQQEIEGLTGKLKAGGNSKIDQKRLRAQLGQKTAQLNELSDPWTDLDPSRLNARQSAQVSQVVVGHAVRQALQQGLIGSRKGKDGSQAYQYADFLKSPDIRGMIEYLTQEKVGPTFLRNFRSGASGIFKAAAAQPAPAAPVVEVERARRERVADSAARAVAASPAAPVIDPMAAAEKKARSLMKKLANIADDNSDARREATERLADHLKASGLPQARVQKLWKKYSGDAGYDPGYDAAQAVPGGGPVAGPPAGRRRGEPTSRWDKFKDATSRAANYGAAGAVLYGGISQLQSGIKLMVEYEAALTNVQRVLNPLGSDLRKLSDEAKAMGQEFGAPITKVVDAMTIFAQQGRSQADILNQTRTAILATNVTELDMVESTEALTAAQKQFQLSSTDSLRILDAWNEVENTTAVNARVLTEALKNAGTVARIAGVDFDSFNGMAAAMGEATRKSGEAIGTSLKFIFQNARSDQAVESLQEVGVLTATTSGGFRSFKDVVGELAGKWNDLTEEQRHNVGVSIAGVRRLNDFFVLMENWDRAMDITVSSMSSSGSAMRENQVAMQSLSKQVEQLKASYESLWASLGESGALDVLKGVTNGLKNVLSLAGGLNKAAGGGLGGMVGVLGAASFVAAPLLAGMGGRMMGRPDPFHTQGMIGPGAAAVAAPGTAGLAAGGVPSLVENAPAGRYGRFLASRAGSSLGGMLLTHAASSYYDNNLRATAGDGQNLAKDAVTSGIDTALMMRMFTRPGGWKAQGRGGKAAIIGTALYGASQLYGSYQDYRRKRDDDQSGDKKLDGIRSLEDRLSTTRADVKGTMESVRLGRNDVDAAKLLDLQDQLYAVNPGGRGLDDLKGGVDATNALMRGLSNQRTGVINAQIGTALNSDEVRKAAEARRQLEGERSRYAPGSKEAFETQGKLAETTATFQRELFQRVRASAVQSGRDRAGLGDLGGLINQVSGSTGISGDILRSSAIRDYLQTAMRGGSVDVKKLLADSKMSESDFFTKGKVQYDKGGPVFDVASGNQTVATANGKVIKLYENTDAMVVLTSKRIAEFVSDYTKALRSITESNRDLIESNKFVADNLVQARDVSGQASAYSGGGVVGVQSTIDTLADIRKRDVRDFARPLGTGDANNVSTSFRELIGQITLAAKQGKTLGLDGAVQGGQTLDSLLQGITKETDRYLDIMMQRRGLTDRKADDEEVSTNVAEDHLAKLFQQADKASVFELVRKKLDEAQTAKDAGRTTDAEALSRQAKELTAGTIFDSAAEARRITKEGARDVLGRYVTTARDATSTLGDRYTALSRAGQVGSVGDFMARPEIAKVVAGLREERDALGRTAAGAKGRLNELVARGDKSPEGQRAVTDQTARVKEVTSAFDAMDATVRNLTQNVESWSLGMQRLMDSIDREGASARNGGAYGLTGNNAAKFQADYAAKKIAEFNGKRDKGEITEVQWKEAVERWSDIQREAQKQSGITADMRDMARKGLGTNVAIGRVGAAFGVRSGTGVGGYVEAELGRFRELSERMGEALGPKLAGKSDGEVREVMDQVREALGPIGGMVRDLENATNPEFQKQYLLASPSQRALVDAVRSSMRDGASAEDVFADPYLRDAAKGDPMLSQLAGDALSRDAERTALEYQNRIGEEGNRYLQQLVTLFQGWGLRLDTSGMGVSGGGGAGTGQPGGHRIGTLQQRSSMSVDAEGRIREDGTPAILHKGEVVLNRSQSDALLKNKFASGTLRGDPEVLSWLAGGDRAAAPGGTTGPLGRLTREGLLGSFSGGEAKAVEAFIDRAGKVNDSWLAQHLGRGVAGGNYKRLDLTDPKRGDVLGLARSLAEKHDMFGMGSGTRRFLDFANLKVEKLDPSINGVAYHPEVSGGKGGPLSVDRSRGTVLSSVSTGRNVRYNDAISALLYEEAGHALDAATWSNNGGKAMKSAAQKAGNRDFYKQMLAVVLDKSDPVMRDVRASIFRGYHENTSAIFGAKNLDSLLEGTKLQSLVTEGLRKYWKYSGGKLSPTMRGVNEALLPWAQTRMAMEQSGKLTSGVVTDIATGSRADLMRTLARTHDAGAVTDDLLRNRDLWLDGIDSRIPQTKTSMFGRLKGRLGAAGEWGRGATSGAGDWLSGAAASTGKFLRNSPRAVRYLGWATGPRGLFGHQGPLAAARDATTGLYGRAAGGVGEFLGAGGRMIDGAAGYGRSLGASAWGGLAGVGGGLRGLTGSVAAPFGAAYRGSAAFLGDLFNPGQYGVVRRGQPPFSHIAVPDVVPHRYGFNNALRSGMGWAGRNLTSPLGRSLGGLGETLAGYGGGLANLGRGVLGGPAAAVGRAAASPLRAMGRFSNWIDNTLPTMLGFEPNGLGRGGIPYEEAVARGLVQDPAAAVAGPKGAGTLGRVADWWKDLRNPGYYPRSKRGAYPFEHLLVGDGASRYRYGVNERFVGPATDWLKRAGSRGAGGLASAARWAGTSIAESRAAKALAWLPKGGMGAARFLGRNPALPLTALMLAEGAWGQKLADKAGFGDGYKNNFAPLLHGGLGLGLATTVAKTGSLSGLVGGAGVGLDAAGLAGGLGLRSMAVGRIATTLEGAGWMRTAGALGTANAGLSAVTRVAGRGLAYVEAAKIGTDLGRMPYEFAHWAGLGVNDRDIRYARENTANIKESFGSIVSSPLTALYGLGEGAVSAARGKGFSSDTLRGQGQTASAWWDRQKEMQGAQFDAAWKGRDWYNPLDWVGGAYQTVGGVVGTATDWSGARAAVHDKAIAEIGDRARKVGDLLDARPFDWTRSAKDGPLKQTWAEVDGEFGRRIKAQGGDAGDGKLDYEGRLAAQRSQAQATFDAYEKYLGGARTDDPSYAESAKKLQSVREYIGAIDQRLSRYRSMKDDDGRALEQYGSGLKAVYPEGYKKVMSAGAREMIAALVSGVGVEGVDPAAIDKLSEAAGELPLTTTLSALLASTGTGGFDTVRRDLGAQTFEMDQARNAADLEKGGAGKSRDRFGEFRERIKRSLNKGGAENVLASALRKNELEAKFFGGTGPQGIAGTMSSIGGELKNASNFAKLLDSLKGRYGDYNSRYEQSLAEAKSLMERMALPAYTPGVGGDAIWGLFDYYDQVPSLEERAKGLRSDYGSAQADTAKLMEAYGKLPAHTRGDFWMGKVSSEKDLTPAMLIGGDPLKDPSDLAGYFGESGQFAEWYARAMATAQQWDEAVGAGTAAGQSKAKLAARDTRKRLIEAELVKKVDGKVVARTRAGQVEGADAGTFYGGDALTQLRGNVKGFNADIDARTDEGRRLLKSMAMAEMRGEVTTPEGLEAMADRASPGLLDAIQRYAAISNQIGGLAGNRDAEADLSRSRLEQQKADLVLERPYPEPFYREVADYLTRRRDVMTKAADARRAAAGTHYFLNGSEVDSAGADTFRAKPKIRHAGGLTTGETVIQSGDRPEWVMDAGMVQDFKTSVLGLRELLAASKGGRQEDSLSADARQYAVAQNINVGGTVQHTGEVVLRMDEGVEGLLRQLIEIVAAGSKGAPVRLGDKVFNPLVGG